MCSPTTGARDRGQERLAVPRRTLKLWAVGVKRARFGARLAAGAREIGHAVGAHALGEPQQRSLALVPAQRVSEARRRALGRGASVLYATAQSLAAHDQMVDDGFLVSVKVL